MKIALPSNNGNVDDHFGHCSYYTIFVVENSTMISKETMESPVGCGCKSNIAPILAQAGITLMLAGNMGEGARNVLNANGIEVIRGCSGAVEDVAQSWIDGTIKDNMQSCNHHEDGHTCSH